MIKKKPAKVIPGPDDLQKALMRSYFSNLAKKTNKKRPKKFYSDMAKKRWSKEK